MCVPENKAHSFCRAQSRFCQVSSTHSYAHAIKRPRMFGSVGGSESHCARTALVARIVPP